MANVTTTHAIADPFDAIEETGFVLERIRAVLDAAHEALVADVVEDPTVQGNAKARAYDVWLMVKLATDSLDQARTVFAQAFEDLPRPFPVKAA
jgi:hypothetical protein